VPNLTPLELATDSVFGIDPAIPSLAPESSSSSPLVALERAVLPAVAKPPCVVTFSGGRDSSLILAVAARVARREGLPLPVPATLRFVGLEHAEESKWQDMVLGHLKLDQRVILDIRSELDLVGPRAGRLLLRHGILWPLNVYLHAALIAPARGGSLMTGMTGDSLFGEGRWFRTQEVLSGRRRPEPRDILRVGLAFAPRWVRQPVLRRRVETVPWLRKSARQAYIEARSRAEASTPWQWDRWVDHLSRRRAWRVANESMSELAVAEGTTHVQPLGDRSFLGSLARAGGRHGFGDRTMVMRALFAEVLPDPVLARSDKARFGAAFIGSHTREFAWAWQGRGVDPDIVDLDALRAAWVTERFNPRAALLLQAAWLHEKGGHPAG